jgi:hypothetical protein
VTAEQGRSTGLGPAQPERDGCAGSVFPSSKAEGASQLFGGIGGLGENHLFPDRRSRFDFVIIKLGSARSRAVDVVAHDESKVVARANRPWKAESHRGGGYGATVQLSLQNLISTASANYS